MTRATSPRMSMYDRWYNMLARCENPSAPNFEHYGGRGISVCERWHELDAYLADVGFPPAPGMTIDRIDNDGDYEPGNIRWATAQEQRQNQRPAPSICGAGLHEFTEENTYRDTRGWRNCRACQRRRRRRRTLRAAAARAAATGEEAR